MSNKSDKHSHSPTISECESRSCKQMAFQTPADAFESNIFRLRRHSRSDAGFSDHSTFMDFQRFGDFRFPGVFWVAKRAGQIDANIVVEYGMRLAHSARRVLSEPSMIFYATRCTKSLVLLCDGNTLPT